MVICQSRLTKAGGKGSKEAVDDRVEGKKHSQSQNKQCCSEGVSKNCEQIFI